MTDSDLACQGLSGLVQDLAKKRRWHHVYLIHQDIGTIACPSIGASQSDVADVAAVKAAANPEAALDTLCIWQVQSQQSTTFTICEVEDLGFWLLQACFSLFCGDQSHTLMHDTCKLMYTQYCHVHMARSARVRARGSMQ